MSGLALSGLWLGWLQFGPARPPWPQSPQERLGSSSRVANVAALEVNGSADDQRPVAGIRGETLKLSTVIESDAKAWFGGGNKKWPRNQAELEKLLVKAGPNNPPRMDLSVRFVRWSLFGEVVESLTAAKHRWVNDSTAEVRAEVTLPARIGTYEMRLVLREIPLGGDLKSAPKTTLASRRVQVSSAK
jgi:hypothetical protein